MLTQKDVIYFTDPLAHAASPKRFIQYASYRDRMYEPEVGMIRNVKSFGIVNNQFYYTADNGNYYAGVPLDSGYASSYQSRLAITDYGFVYGEVQQSSNDGTTVLQVSRRSDRKQVTNGQRQVLHLTTETLFAAPWALELLPMPTDSDEVVAAKLLAAKEKFKLRYAKGAIHMECHNRSWEDDLEDLDYELEGASWDVCVKGTALIPLDIDPNVEHTNQVAEALEKLRDNTGRVSALAGTSMMIGVTTEHVHRLLAETPDRAIAQQPRTLPHLQRLFGGQSTFAPVQSHAVVGGLR